MAFFAQIWVAVFGVNLAVLAIFVSLATLQFDSVSTGLAGERLAALASRTSAPFSAAAKIGLPLATVRNAEAIIENARQTDDAILAIHIFDTSGNVVHSTRTPAPARIPLEAEEASRSAGADRWHRRGETGFYSGVGIANAAGENVGGILIAYPLTGNAIEIRAMLAELGLSALGILLISSALGALLLRVGLARPVALFEAIDNEIVGFERDTWRSAAGAEPHADEVEGSLRSRLDLAVARYRETGLALTPENENQLDIKRT